MSFVVHIVDDEAPVRKSLAFMLASAGYAVRAFGSAADFLSQADDTQGGCLITDLRMPGMNGVELLQALRKADAMLPAIVITGHGDVPMAVEAMKAGALDFIEKPFEEEVLLQALERAARQLANRKISEDHAPTVRARVETLTDRERQVLSGVVAGLPNKSIAYDLQISPRTVEVYRSNVMMKMQAKSLPELVRMTLHVDLGGANKN
ncbi:MAG TPA: response regulator FixJ [Pararhizobium sp.]|uniref:response regulator FixJ n=1 Tax=Pararhizobium sp. TaxID=1977563 RepID=UPI002CE46BE5|nr:response regulator FixJ [Pararhizobium sp.]HTO33147.1 response regulator FixJ [Pararhizobium sp.]